jgi:Uma2 family endonuclease
MAPTITKCTLSQYQAMVEAGALDHQFVELIHGEIVEMPPEGPEHAHRNTSSADLLRRLLGDRAHIRDAKPITFSEQTSEPQPDIAIVAPLGDIYAQRHPYPEDIFLLIEYAKTTVAKDTDQKRKLYAREEIQDYWVVNLKTKELIVYRDPQDGDYRSVQTLTTGIIVPIAFPDVEIRIKALL